MTSSGAFLHLSGQVFPIDLYTKSAPKACTGLLSGLPIERELIPAAWSGPLALLTGINLDNAPLENPVTFLTPVTITYHPTHHDLGFAYGPTNNVEPRGPSYVSLIGSLSGDITRFIEICEALRHQGSIGIRIAAER